MVWGTVGSWANSTAENTIAAADCSTSPAAMEPADSRRLALDTSSHPMTWASRASTTSQPCAASGGVGSIRAGRGDRCAPTMHSREHDDHRQRVEAAEECAGGGRGTRQLAENWIETEQAGSRDDVAVSAATHVW